MEKQDTSSGNYYRKLRNKAMLIIIFVSILLGLILFISAGSVAYWQAWVCCAVYFISTIGICIYLLKNNPKLLERRMRIREKEREQKLFFKLALLVLVTAFIISGLDYRFKWSYVPIVVIIIADMICFLCYLLFIVVLKENEYASRIIEIENGQKVISTGPYAVIRHPMYLAAMVIYGCSPIALGSWWALLAVIPLPVLFIFRILNEEKTLMKNLAGYNEYIRKVKYRLIPFIW